MARTSPRRWRSGWAPAPASTTSPLTGSRRRDSPTAGSSRLEEPFLELTGAPLRLETFEDATSAWDAARAAVDRGRPAILLTDLYHLDQYGKSGTSLATRLCWRATTTRLPTSPTPRSRTCRTRSTVRSTTLHGVDRTPVAGSDHWAVNRAK